MDMFSVDEAGDRQGRGKRRTVRCRESAGSPAMKDSEQFVHQIFLPVLRPPASLASKRLKVADRGEQERMAMAAEPIRDHITTPSILLSDGAKLRLNKTNRLRGGGS
jgi:hypothetical protein